MATINYVDKEALNVNPNILDKNKVNASDMNLIKVVGNQILTTMGVYTDDWNSATTYAIGEIAIYDNRIFKNLTGTNTATTPDLDTTNWEETTISAMAAGAASGDTLPIGSIVPYGTTTAPTNWLVCDGSAVSRTTYANLFAVIGTSFGSGDGSTTFNLPNLKGRVAVGQDTSDTSFDTMGETGGEKTHTLTIDEMPSHKHTVNYSSSPGTSVGVTAMGTKLSDSSQIVQATGGGQAHNNLQPYQVVCYIIKANQSAGLVANVSTTKTSSATDTYSCNYINGILNGVCPASFNDKASINITSVNGYGVAVLFSTMYGALVQFQGSGNNPNVITIYGTPSFTTSASGNIVTLSSLNTWDHYIMFGSIAISKIE